MLKEIRRPENIFLYPFLKDYSIQNIWYKSSDDLFYIKSFCKTTLYSESFCFRQSYLNKLGEFHKIDGPAIINEFYNTKSYIYYINGCWYSTIGFAQETNHLTCIYCKEFCKQKCF